jgi:hypothetical protein
MPSKLENVGMILTKFHFQNLPRPPYLFYAVCMRVSEAAFRKSRAKVLTNYAVLLQLTFTFFYLEVVVTQKF